MFKSKSSKKSHPKDLYSDLTPEQREEANANLHAYFEVIYRIYEELEAKGTLDEELKKANLRKQWEKRNKK